MTTNDATRRLWRSVYDAIGELMEDAIEREDKELEVVLGKIDDMLSNVDPRRRP